VTGAATTAAPLQGVRPVLKWAGGKRQLLPALRPFYPETFACYIEPFVGSGAVFLDLLNSGRTAGHDVRLSDINADVIGCYRTIRDAVEDVIAALWRLDEGHRLGGREHFYEVRNHRFNPARRAVHAGPRPEEAYTPELAAMLIYLNRTGYNGLFRVNSQGEFNVPAGRHGTVRICDPANLRRLAEAFASPKVSIEVQPFDGALAAAARGDFVYLDPPYSPVSRTSNFTSYTAARFGAEEQASLQRRVIELASSGAHVLLSNSFAPDISALYENTAAKRAGLLTRTVQARRAINSRASSRGPVLEYLITNVPGAH
jgi:DNA adenine methylase